MIVIERTVDISKPIQTETLRGNEFKLEANAHTFRISVANNGAAVALTGSVSASMLLADGSGLTLGGSLDNGVAVLTLPQAAYGVPGRFMLAIYSVQTGATEAETVKTCIYACVGAVINTYGEQQYDPGNLIPDAETLAAYIEACQTATAAANTAAGRAETAALTAVTYAEQTGKTDAEKAQARTNIGAASEADVDAAMAEHFPATGKLVAGISTTASANGAVATGVSTTASGRASHAEGQLTTADGQVAHAEGYGTTASGDYSHAEGFGTKASGDHQHAFGKYNVEDANDTYVEIAGNGTGENARSNARTLDWSGNETLAGDLTVNKGGAGEMVLGQEVSSLKSALNERAPIGTVGFNVWDEEYIVKSGNHIETKNYIPVEPETNYYLQAPANPGYGLWFYDKNYNRISTWYNRGLFTTPANCRYIKFGISDSYGTVYNNDICLNISQPDTSIEPHNGQYVPGNYLKNYSDLLNLKIAINGNATRIETAEANINSQQASIIELADKVGVFETEPVLRNGSNGTKWNESFVCTAWNADTTTIDFAVSPGDVVSLEITRPLSAADNHYSNGYTIYNSSKERIAEYLCTSQTWYENIVIPEEVAYIAFVIGEYTSENAKVTLRTTDFASGQVKIQQIIHDGLEKRVSVLEEDIGSVSPRIVKQNEDVSPAVDACGRYGLHSGGVMNNSRNFCMLVTTDVHQATENMKSAIDYLNEKEAIQYGCCLGDMAAGNYAQTDGTWYTSLVNASDKPFYTVIGNHDGGNSKDISISATVAQSFAKWIEPTLSKIGLPSLNVPYYAINTDYNVTLIMLNNYDVPDTMDGTNFAVSRGDEVLSQTQVNWLLSTLDNVPSTNHLLVLMHSYPYANEAVESIFSQYGYRPSGSSRPAYAEIIPDIINAWMAGTALQKTYTPQIDSDYLDNIVINHDFSSHGTGVFVGYLVGHTHKDIIAKSSVYTDQNVYCLTDTAGGTWQNEGSDLPRVDGTKTQDAVTVIGIDTNARLVKLVRIGSNITTRMINRTMTAIQY